MIAAAAGPGTIAGIEPSAAVGWLLLAFGTCAAIVMIRGREAVARWWLGAEDPRPIALFRIVFAALVLADILSLAPHYTFFFTDEGLYASDEAQAAYAAAQFAGYGDGLGGDPRGFFDLRGLLQLFTGPKFSLLYFWDSPTAFHLHLAAFVAATLAFLIGLRTRIAGVLSFLLFNSLLYRAEILWEGTEMVFRSVFFLLLFARSGHALSVDNLLRCRRLRRRGALHLPDGTGLCAAIYRRIPAWPRRLLVLQTAAIYGATGAAKSGPIWAAGDALYYALNLAHFHRFDPQGVSALLGTNLFRVMTWVTLAWEILFPLVIVGEVLRWRQRAAIAAPEGSPRRGDAVAWWALGLLGLALVLAWDRAGGRALTAAASTIAALVALWIAGMAGLHALVRRLRRGPIELALAGARLRIDAASLRAWLLGRRLWLGLGVVFQGLLLVLMSIGLFQPVMLALTLAFLDGGEVQALLARLRIPGARIPAGDPEPRHLHRDRAALPAWALWAALCLALVGVVVAAQGRDPRRLYPFLAAIAALVVGAAIVARRRAGGPDDGGPWAYGPVGRALVMLLALAHCLAIALWLLPKRPATAAFRRPARELARPWVKATQTAQSWEMFAPDPPTVDLLLRVLVIDPAGATWDMNTDVYAPEQRPIPNLGYDRMRKVNRRVIADPRRFAPAIARYHCRAWALTHGGEPPREVRLMRLRVAIPPPEELAARGPYDPMDRLRRLGEETLLHAETCADAPEGQLRDAVRLRHGLGPAPPGSLRPNAKRRLEAWRRLHPGGS